jgi:DNA-binding PadR family transcriptional regulator
MKELSKAEEMVLLAIWRLKDRAYGVSIRKMIFNHLGKDFTYGTLYGLLRQLDHKEYIEKFKSEPTPHKGGRSKTYFKLTPTGITALKEAVKMHRRIWEDINEFSFDTEHGK